MRARRDLDQTLHPLSGSVATLSELVADLSRQLAQALKETPLASRNGASQP